MNLIFIINTPGQAYTWLHPITEFIKKGHSVRIIARNYESTPKILKAAGLQYITFKPVGSRIWRIFGTLNHLEKCFQYSLGFHSSLFVGFGFDAAVVAALFRKPSIMFIDDDHTHFQNDLTSRFASLIVTPDCFIGELGKRHIRVHGYKELAYLHPHYFTPDVTIYDELQIPRGSPYVILRFNIGDAIHDIGWHGFSKADEIRLVHELKKYAHVFISPEKPIPPELEQYRLQIPYHRIHHALYYAQMFVGDTGTMTTEAATLGTPGITCNTLSLKMGNFIELDRKYNLIYCFDKSEDAIHKAVELINSPDLKKRWAEKRERLLREKVDVSQFMIDVIENYPEIIQRKNKGFN